MGGDFSGKNQDCSKGIYALAGESFMIFWLFTSKLISVCCLIFSTVFCTSIRVCILYYSETSEKSELVPRSVVFTWPDKCINRVFQK